MFRWSLAKTVDLLQFSNFPFLAPPLASPLDPWSTKAGCFCRRYLRRCHPHPPNVHLRGTRHFLSGLLYLHSHHEWTKTCFQSGPQLKMMLRARPSTFHVTIHPCLPITQSYLRTLWNKTGIDLGSREVEHATPKRERNHHALNSETVNPCDFFLWPIDCLELCN